MWLAGYFIGVVVGALLVAYSITYDALPVVIVLRVVAALLVGMIVVATLAA